jgi:predicted dehydrogenase
VCDHQIVNFAFEQGQTASFTMIACTEKTCARQTSVYGSKGQIECDGDETVKWVDFNTGKSRSFRPLRGEGLHSTDSEGEATSNKESVDVGRLVGHHGADFFLMRCFIRAVRSADPILISSGAQVSLKSHRVVFAAEKARKEGRVVNMDE